MIDPFGDSAMWRSIAKSRNHEIEKS